MDSSEKVLEEAVELSEAVLSEGESYFENEYEGELETYMIVEDIRNRIEIATMDSGEMVYPEELPSLEELGGEDAARVLRENPLEPGNYKDIFKEKEILEKSEDSISYRREAFAYFLLLDEAERMVKENYGEGAEEVEVEKNLEPGPEEETVDPDEVNEDNEEAEVKSDEPEDKVEELRSIWEDVSSE